MESSAANEWINVGYIVTKQFLFCILKTKTNYWILFKNRPYKALKCARTKRVPTYSQSLVNAKF